MQLRPPAAVAGVGQQGCTVIGRYDVVGLKVDGCGLAGDDAGDADRSAPHRCQLGHDDISVVLLDRLGIVTRRTAVLQLLVGAGQVADGGGGVRADRLEVGAPFDTAEVLLDLVGPGCSERLEPLLEDVVGEFAGPLQRHRRRDDQGDQGDEEDDERESGGNRVVSNKPPEQQPYPRRVSPTSFETTGRDLASQDL